MKMKLGKLPNTNNVRMSISIPEALKSQLDRYAQLHSRTWGQQVDPATLIPHILAHFLSNDRAFDKFEKTDRSKTGGDNYGAAAGLD